jgi:hypothetical protein
MEDTSHKEDIYIILLDLYQIYYYFYLLLHVDTGLLFDFLTTSK